MKDGAEPFPPENQWRMLAAHGFSSRFAGTWVEHDDAEVVASLLRADPASRLDCDLQTAMRWYEPYERDEEIVWIGAHSLGWSHITSISGDPIHPLPLSANGRRLFSLEYDDGEGGVHGLSYFRDGGNRGQYGRDSNEQGELEGLFSAYDVELTPVDEDEAELNDYLRLIGRVTGRFIDQEWLRTPRSLYRIPDGAWDH